MKVPYNAPVIQTETVFFNRTVHPIISVELIPGKLTDPLLTKFTWTYVNFTSQELYIQLNFDQLNYVSSTSSYPD